MLCSRAAAILHTSACRLETCGMAKLAAVCNHAWRLTIVLCLLGQDHLRVALGPQGPRLQQRLCEVDTPLVHIQARSDLQ